MVQNNFDMKKILLLCPFIFLYCAYPPPREENPHFRRKENPRYVRKENPPQPALRRPKEKFTSSALTEKFKKEIQKFYGTPYLWGGASRAGADCSGLIVALYQNAAGITLPHSARQLFQHGKRVNVNRLTFGDLVFFDTFGERKATHVGFYISNGFFLHASSSKGVILSNLSDLPYKNQYVGARRIL